MVSIAMHHLMPECHEYQCEDWFVSDAKQLIFTWLDHRCRNLVNFAL